MRVIGRSPAVALAFILGGKVELIHHPGWAGDDMTRARFDAAHWNLGPSDSESSMDPKY
jgi:hypothetical protein